MKGSKKKKQDDGNKSVKKQIGKGWGNVKLSETEIKKTQSGGAWQNSGDFWSKLPLHL